MSATRAFRMTPPAPPPGPRAGAHRERCPG
jgi:hypothetical protein